MIWRRGTCTARRRAPEAPAAWILAAPLPRAIVATLLLACAPRAAGQRLDLDPTPKAPALPERNAASALAGALAKEVDVLTARAKEKPESAWKVEPSLAWRRVAHELLVRGGEPANPRHDLVEAGFRLADARAEFDRAIDRIPPSGGGSEHARAGLDRFVAAPATLRATESERLAAVLERSLATLDDALQVAGLPAVKTPWPIVGGTGGAGDSAPWSERIRAASKSPSLAPEVASSLDRLAQRVADAEAWSEFAGELGAVAEPLVRVPVTVDAITGAGWLPKSRQSELLDRVTRSVSAMESAEGRDSALAQLRHLAAIADAIEATDALVHPASSKGPRGAIDPTRPLKAILALAAPVADDGVDGRVERLGMITQLLRTMAEVRSREEREVDRTRRALRRELSRDALKSEDPVLRQVESLAAPDAAPTDPACASLLASQRRRIRALDALDGVDRALGEIESRLPAASKALAARWNATLRTLGDSAKGETALRSAEAFVTQWKEVRELPVEAMLRRGDAAATELCAGRVPELLAGLDRRREAWAAAWSEGDGERAAAAITSIVALFELVEDAAALSRQGADPRVIGRWGGWDDLGGIPGATDAMDARVALAVEALARGDDAALKEALSLQAREAPIWRLRARLIRLLAEPLASLPDGISGAIGRASRRPRPEAFMARRAADLLTLARYGREYLFAIADHDQERADAIHEFMRGLATELRLEVDRQSEKLATPRTPGH